MGSAAAGWSGQPSTVLYLFSKNRTIASMFSSDPPSQYCIDKNHARRSWDLPGINLRMRGRRRSIAIFFSPDCVDGLEDPRSFFIIFIAPEVGAIISRLPILVSFTIEASAIRLIIASQASRRASRWGRMRKTCSSRNNKFTTIILARSMSSTQAWNASGFSPHSAAACTETCRPG